jgi:[ribosomal protein S5]-alanine N-acetyltransferase
MPPGTYGATTQSTARNLPPPKLETARLVLRPFETRDVEDVFAYASDAEVSRYVLWDRHTTRADSQRFLEWVLGQYARGELPSWGIMDKTSGRVVGSIGYGWPEPAHARAEVGYVLARSHWGRGLMSEAVRAVLGHAFGTLHLHKVVAHCHVLNVGSRRVLEKVGLRHEGRLYEHLFVKGSYWDIDVLGVLDREWLERNGTAPG